MYRTAMRETKNVLKGYTDIQVKLREATSNDPWGPSTTQLQELADSSFNPQLLLQMLDIINKRLNDHGKNWRHVFKTLVVLDYLLHAGAEESIRFVNEHVYLIKTLVEFQYIDEDGRDQGKCIRDKSSDIISLLNDKERLTKEREQRMALSSKLSTSVKPTAGGGDQFEQDLQKALALSKAEFYKEQKYREHASSQQQYDRPQSVVSKPPQSPVDLITVDAFDQPSLNPAHSHYDPFEIESNYVAAPVQQFNDPFQQQQQSQQSQQQFQPQPVFDVRQQQRQPQASFDFIQPMQTMQSQQSNPFGYQQPQQTAQSQPFSNQFSSSINSQVSQNPFGQQSNASSNPFGQQSINPPSSGISTYSQQPQTSFHQQIPMNQQIMNPYANTNYSAQQTSYQRGGSGLVLEPTPLTNVQQRDMPAMIPSLTGLPAQKAPIYQQQQVQGSSLVNLDNIFDNKPPKQFGKQSSPVSVASISTGASYNRPQSQAGNRS
eukprot:NODE_448_length_8440_cov_0.772329.p2 type:complete len:489 gc:universal NODE_448_length_8440_cov_0.772329:1899-433(-)